MNNAPGITFIKAQNEIRIGNPSSLMLTIMVPTNTPEEPSKVCTVFCNPDIAPWWIYGALMNNYKNLPKPFTLWAGLKKIPNSLDTTMKALNLNSVTDVMLQYTPLQQVSNPNNNYHINFNNANNLQINQNFINKNMNNNFNLMNNNFNNNMNNNFNNNMNAPINVLNNNFMNNNINNNQLNNNFLQHDPQFNPNNLIINKNENTTGCNNVIFKIAGVVIPKGTYQTQNNHPNQIQNNASMPIVNTNQPDVNANLSAVNTSGGINRNPPGVNANTITLKCVNNAPNGLRNNDISFDDIVIGKGKTIGELKKRILKTRNNGKNNLLQTLNKTENDFVICKVDQEGNPEMILEDKNMPISLAFHGDSSYVIVPRYIHCEIIVNNSPRIFKYPVVVKNAQYQDDFNKTTLKAFIDSELGKQGEAIESCTFEYWIDYKNVKLVNGWVHAGFNEIKGGSITIKKLQAKNLPGVNANLSAVNNSGLNNNQTSSVFNIIQNEGYIQNNDGGQIQNNNIKKPNDILTSGYNNLQNTSVPQPIIIPVKKEGPTVIPVFGDNTPVIGINPTPINNHIRFPNQPPQLNLNQQTAIQTKNELESLTIKRNVDKMLANLLQAIENGNFGGPKSPSSAIKNQIQSNKGSGLKVEPIYDEIEETKSNQNNPSSTQTKYNPHNQLANQQMLEDEFKRVDRNVKKMLADLSKDIENGNFGGPKLQIRSQKQPKQPKFQINNYPTSINNPSNPFNIQTQCNPNNQLANQQMLEDEYTRVKQNTNKMLANIFNLFKIYSKQIKKPINKKIKKIYTKKIYTTDNGI